MKCSRKRFTHKAEFGGVSNRALPLHIAILAHYAKINASRDLNDPNTQAAFSNDVSLKPHSGVVARVSKTKRQFDLTRDWTNADPLPRAGFESCIHLNYAAFRFTHKPEESKARVNAGGNPEFEIRARE